VTSLIGLTSVIEKCRNSSGPRSQGYNTSFALLLILLRSRGGRNQSAASPFHGLLRYMEVSTCRSRHISTNSFVKCSRRRKV